ncbi:MAG: hypothetical protein ACMUIP_07050 [bacterium]
MKREITRDKKNVIPSSNQEVFSTIFQEINTLKEYSQKHEQALHKLETTLEHLNRELIKREAETPWIIKAIEEANQKTTQVFIDLINKTYGNNQRLFKIIFILLGAILALSGAREAVTILFK